MFMRNEFPIVDTYFELTSTIKHQSPERTLNEYCFLLSLNTQTQKYVKPFADRYKLHIDEARTESFKQSLMSEEKLNTALTTDNQLNMLAIARSKDMDEVLLLIFNPNATTKVMDELYERFDDRDIRTLCLTHKNLSKNHAKDAQKRYGSFYCDLFLAMNDKLYTEVKDLEYSLVQSILAVRNGKSAV